MSRIAFFRTIAPVALSLLVTACERAGADVTDTGSESQLPPPAAAIAAEADISIEARLEHLEDDLRRVQEGGLDEASQVWLMTAEAATDRLLEERLPAGWLATGYLVEARLRQIQALADRIVAELSRGVAKELVLEDVAALRGAVHDLRSQLAAQGNGDAPPTLDSLLVNYGNEPRIGIGGGGGAATPASSDSSTAPAPEPVAAPAGGPLGQPVPDR